MTQSREPNENDRNLRRKIREIDWRVQRLEATQMPARSIDEGFQQVYEEIDELKAEMNQQFDNMNQRLDSLDAKFDTIMRHITGQSNT